MRCITKLRSFIGYITPADLSRGRMEQDPLYIQRRILGNQQTKHGEEVRDCQLDEAMGEDCQLRRVPEKGPGIRDVPPFPPG